MQLGGLAGITALAKVQERENRSMHLNGREEFLNEEFAVEKMKNEGGH
jgi:hypothetical protein